MKPQPVPQQSGFDQGKMYVWIKGLETKTNNLLRQVDVLKNDLMRKNTDLRQDVKSLNQDMLELKRQREKDQETMDLIIKELKRTAGKEEITVLKKYLEYWNPLNFVTQQDLERTLEVKTKR